jgi:hypothetical protein
MLGARFMIMGVGIGEFCYLRGGEDVLISSCSDHRPVYADVVMGK